MKVSINWLKDYVDYDCSLEQLADYLTMAGLEVEDVIDLNQQDFIAAGGSGAAHDTVFDVKVTPNRGDWLSMIGVAREVAPLKGVKVKIPVPKVEESGPDTTNLIKIRVDDADLCRRYVGVVVRDVDIKDSPNWLKDRLIAAGMRPINNVVDITNYVMLELGQPLHAFDYSLLHDSQIIVRKALPGEKITSLDSVERELSQDTLVIADADRAVAIAGVMGGADSEINKQTKDILIESANFNSVSVRRTSKRLNMVTESSYRFERCVDPSITVTAALRAAELMQEICGGKVSKGIVDVYPNVVEPLEISVRPQRVNSVLGITITEDEMIRYLNSIEIETCIKDNMLISKVPTFRADITREIDLVEEIGRMYGYDRFGTTLPASSLPGRDSSVGAFQKRLRETLMCCGGQEVLTHSIVDSKLARIVGKDQQSLIIRNPLSEELDAMRVMLTPNLLQVIARNQAFGSNDASIFEIGKVYYHSPEGQIGERLAVAGAMIGNLWNNHWNLPESALAVDFFICKGALESLFDGLGITGVRFEATEDAALHPTRTARIMADDKVIGIMGEASPDVADALNVRGRPYVFELDFMALMQVTPETLYHKDLPKYPALYRHIDVVVLDKIKYEDLADAIRKTGGDVIEAVDLLDVYKNEQMGEDQRSLTLSVVFRSKEATLTDEVVNSVLTEIKENLLQKFGVSFR